DKEMEKLAKFIEQEELRAGGYKPKELIRNLQYDKMRKDGNSFRSEAHHGDVEWKPKNLKVDNKTMLDSYMKQYGGIKGLLFYFVEVKDDEGNNVGLLAKSEFLDLTDYEGSLVKMNEISSHGRFHSWAGSHTPSVDMNMTTG